jgi:hypothetical protein
MAGDLLAAGGQGNGRGKMANGGVFSFQIHSRSGSRAETVAVSRFVIAGWTGRDTVKMEEHIRELEALGVKRPARTPIFYRAAAARLTLAGEIEVSGGASSGEVEYMLLRHQGRVLVGLGSDHTDREVETYGITVSKQMCDKPVAAALWEYAEVRDHWDRLQLRSWIMENGTETIYQDGAVAAMLHPDVLMAAAGESDGFADGTAMLCGTLPAIGGIRPSGYFRMELHDPVLQRRISGGYAIRELPIRG